MAMCSTTNADPFVFGSVVERLKEHAHIKNSLAAWLGPRIVTFGAGVNHPITLAIFPPMFAVRQHAKDVFDEIIHSLSPLSRSCRRNRERRRALHNGRCCLRDDHRSKTVASGIVATLHILE